ncbi:MAG: sensor histidine kinase, partial [Dermatophilaceae bacterium]
GWPDGLRLLVDNLVVNAVRHGRPPVRVEVAQHGDRAQLVVDDAGPGIPPEAREVVFRRFARGRSVAAGSGLGLAIVAQQVRWHTGTVTVGEAPAGGARFVVDLPVAPLPVDRGSGAGRVPARGVGTDVDG